MNKVILIGRLTADPEMRQTQSGSMMMQMSLAVDRRSAEGEKSADFFRCFGFGKTAEIITKYFSKGDPILIEGNLKTGQYTDKNYPDVKHYTTDVWIERFEFTPKNPGKDQQQAQQTQTQQQYAQYASQPQQPTQQQYYSHPAQQPQQPQYQQQTLTTDSFTGFDTSDLPF